MTRRTFVVEARRKALIRAIKAAQRHIGIDDDTYREMLERVSALDGVPGRRSSTELTLQQLEKVLEHLRANGAPRPANAAKPRPAGPRSTPGAADRAALYAKVQALLIELGRVQDQAPYAMGYADAICKRNGWCDRVDFAGPNELRKLVGALSRTVRVRARARAVHTLA